MLVNKDDLGKLAPSLSIGKSYTIKFSGDSCHAGYFKLKPSKSGVIKVSLSNYKTSVKGNHHMYQYSRVKVIDSSLDICGIDISNEDSASAFSNEIYLYSEKGRKLGLSRNPALVNKYATENSFKLKVKAGKTYYVQFYPNYEVGVDKKVSASCSIKTSYE